MGYQYTFIVSDTEPQNRQPGTFWLHNTSGVLQFKIGEWAQINTATSGLPILDDIYTYITIHQASAPSSPVIGQIWVDNNSVVWIYLGTWLTVCSGFGTGSATNGDLSLISEDLESMFITHGQVTIKLSQAQAFWYLNGNFVPFAGEFTPRELEGAIAVYINGILKNEVIKTKSIKIINSINEQVDTCTFIYEKNLVNGVEAGARIDIYDSKNIIKIFGGQIQKIKQNAFFPGSNTINYKVTCASWEKRLQSRIIAEVYENQYAGDIIKDLIDNYLPEFSYINVQKGLLIDYISFNYKSLDNCIKAIAKETGYNWYIDYEKDIHFFETTQNIAPFSLNDTSNNFKNFNISYDSSQIRNRILIQGGYFLEDYNLDVKVADGEQVTFRTAYKPFAPVKIYVDTGSGFVEKTLGVKNINESGFDFVLDYNEKTVENLDLATLNSGDIVKITYKKEVLFFSQGEDSQSIANLKRIEGGDGIREYTIKDENIVTIDAANQRIKAELNDYANPKVKGSFSTTSYGLRSGQLLNIVLSNFEINTSYLIQKVSIKIFNDSADVNKTLLQYDVEFMTLLKGLQEFLLNLYNKDRDIVVGENEIINGFRQVSDEITISDSISYISHSPTYLWDDPSTKWDLFSWS
jgi:hypothetical protein